MGGRIVLFFANKWFKNRRPEPEGAAATERPKRVLVLANQQVESQELLDELHASTQTGATTYFVVVPVSPIETGIAATHGPLDLREATLKVAQERLDNTLATLHSENLDARRRDNRRRKRHDLGDPGVEVLGHALDRAALAGRVPALEHHDDPGLLHPDPLLQLHELGLQPEQLCLVN